MTDYVPLHHYALHTELSLVPAAQPGDPGLGADWSVTPPCITEPGLMRLLPSVLREERRESRRGVDMRGEIFTGEKCSKAGQRGSMIKPGDFEIQNTSIDGKLAQHRPTQLLSKLFHNQPTICTGQFLFEQVCHILYQRGRGGRFSVVPTHVLC